MEQPKNVTNSQKFTNLDSFEIYFRNTLHTFKEEILSSVRDVESRAKSSNQIIIENINAKLDQYDKTFDDFEIKINDINTVANLDKMKLSKIDDLVVFQKKANDQFISYDVKVNSLQKDVTAACYKYDKIYLDNLIVPGTIGDFAQFKNMREYVDYSYGHVTSLIAFKDKQMADWKSYKEKLDIMIRQVSSQLDITDRNLKTYTNKMLEATEASFSKEMTDINYKLSDVKIENHKHAFNLQKSANDLTVEYNKILEIKSDIGKQMQDSVNLMKESHSTTVDSFDTVKHEFETIKKKFIELAEFIKDVRFRKNIGADVGRQEFKQMAGQLARKDKRSPENDRFKTKRNTTVFINQSNYDEKDSDIESYVKKYINGGNMKAFEHDKNTTKNDKNGRRENNLITPEKANQQEKIQNESIDESSLDVIDENINEKNYQDEDNILLKKNSKEIHNNSPDSKLSNANDIVFKKCKSNVSKFKDKFPSNQLKSKNIDFDPNMLSNNEKESKEQPKGNVLYDKSEEILSNFKKFNKNFLQFKSEFTQKYSFTEKKLLEIENHSRKKLEELEDKLKNIDFISHNPKLILNNFDKKPSKNLDIDSTIKKSNSNNENYSYVYNSIDNNDNNTFDNNHNAYNHANSNQTYPNSMANRINIMTPNESDKNYIVNIINPGVFPKNSQSSNTNNEKTNTDIMNVYYKENSSRSKPRNTSNQNSNYKINDMFLQYGSQKPSINQQNKPSRGPINSSANNSLRDSSNPHNIKRLNKNDKSLNQRLLTPVAEFSFDSVKNLFMPYVNVLQNNARTDQDD